MEIQEYIDSNKEKILSRLFQFVKIPSVSALSEHKKDMTSATEFLSNELTELGFKNIEICETGGHPVVYGEWLEAGGDVPTVLLYGHYDVQPVDPVDEWDTEPFDPTLKGSRIYSRGISDDKGQSMTHIEALRFFWTSEKKYPVNFKILIEGEEEMGGTNTDKWIEKNVNRLQADVAVLSDTDAGGKDTPSILYGLRGIVYAELFITSSSSDLHSGLYGGAVPNPANILCEMMDLMYDRETGRCMVPGFYDDVVDVSPEERKLLGTRLFDEGAYMKSIGIKGLYGESDYSVTERTCARPTFDINGMNSGFQGEGPKTIIPSSASAKFSMRLVGNQKVEDIKSKLKKFISGHIPEYVNWDLKFYSSAPAVLVDYNSPYIKALKKAYEKNWKNEPVYMRSGGSIGVVGTFKNSLGIDSVMIGYGLPEDNIHAPNESLDMDLFWKGITINVEFYKEIALVKKR